MADEMHPGSGEFAESGASWTGFSPPFRALLRTPEIPGYEVGDELGRGGMGIVYKARQCVLNRPVALKMLSSSLNVDALARQRFRIEAEAVARLEHANIVRIYEIGEHEGKLFLCLEYVEGGNLQRKIAGTPQPVREAARLVETLTRAVHFMHEHGIVHRDLKPSNVLLVSGESSSATTHHSPLTTHQPKITDFGLAKILDSGTGPTRSEEFLGTPSYMAPEQAGGDPGKLGPAADVYALGAILYELLAGRVPFQGANALAILEQVRNREPVALHQIRPSVPVDLETICFKCLEKEPDRRYASALALAEDLHCFLEDRPIQARPISHWRRLWRSARRRPAFTAWAAAAAIVVCLVLAVWISFHAAHQRARHREGKNYQRFVEKRNEALVCAILAPVEGGLFQGADTSSHLQRGESAARAALTLAGMEAESTGADIATGFPVARKTEMADDCYTLLLVLASIRGQHAAITALGPASRAGPAVPLGSRDLHDAKEPIREALRMLHRARQLGFQTRSCYLRESRFLDLLGEKDEARKARDQAALQKPESALDHFLLGEEQYRRAVWQQASISFNHALTLDSGHFWARFFLAICHLRGRQWEAAMSSLNGCISQQPDFVWPYLFRSIVNEELHLQEEAEADFQETLQRKPGDDARYVIHLTRGVHRFNKSDLERAATDFRAAQALKREQYNAYLNLAHVYVAQGRFDDATRQFNAAMSLQPPAESIAAYHLHCGRSLLERKRHEEALQACQTVLSLYPHLALPYELRGRAFLALGRFGQAERAFDECLRKGGEEKADIFRSRGRARMKLGKYPEAAEDFTRALERGATADLYQSLGWAHLLSDAAKLAVRDFSRAIEMIPTSPGAWIGRGVAQARVGQYWESVADVKAGICKLLPVK
jgi:tetratricopeptide (TPR) repeat protein/tRNA A-37 threonylcarbamoyl transferase component Bud32